MPPDPGGSIDRIELNRPPGTPGSGFGSCVVPTHIWPRVSARLSSVSIRRPLAGRRPSTAACQASRVEEGRPLDQS